jgi:TATA-box binding protein (TBP) (component of TFIID and TFIIIB)
VGVEDFSDGPSYFTLNELVHGNTLVSDPTPLQIIRNPRVPDLHAQITNVVCTYRITGERGELLALDRQAIADAARVKMGLACDFQKPGALMTNISLLGADHHPKPMMYKKTATHQLAAHSPEDAVLVAHTFTHELSKIMGVRVYPSPIVVHNIVTVMDAGRHLDRDLIRQVTRGQHRKTSTAASATGKNTRKKFPAEIVYSRRVPPVVFLFFTSGQVTSCGAPTREHVRIGLEEVSEILNAQYQLVIAPGNADLQLDKVSREAVEKRDSMAKANALVRHNLATRPNAPVERTFFSFAFFLSLRSVHIMFLLFFYTRRTVN